jgi:hypothetical protein
LSSAFCKSLVSWFCRVFFGNGSGSIEFGFQNRLAFLPSVFGFAKVLISSQSVSLAISAFGQVRSLKSASWCSEKVLESLRQFFWSGQFVKSKLRRVVAFARSASLTKSFVSASQFFSSLRLSCLLAGQIGCCQRLSSL